jgi:hypothetical protein
MQQQLAAVAETPAASSVAAREQLLRAIDPALCDSSYEAAALLPSAALLRFAGAWAQKVPKNEADYRQQEHHHGPQHLFARVRAALEDVDNRPYISDQNDQSHQSLILHIAPF